MLRGAKAENAMAAEAMGGGGESAAYADAFPSLRRLFFGFPSRVGVNKPKRWMAVLGAEWLSPFPRANPPSAVFGFHAGVPPPGSSTPRGVLTLPGVWWAVLLSSRCLQTAFSSRLVLPPRWQAGISA